jgi:hypothetical protein
MWVPITWQAMEAKATGTARSLEITNFKAGWGWCKRFMCCERLSLRHQTSNIKHQKILVDFKGKLWNWNFQWYVTQLRKKQNYVLNHTGNADKMSVICLKITLLLLQANKKSKLETVCNCTMLFITTEGHILPLYIVLNYKTMLKDEIFPKDMHAQRMDGCQLIWWKNWWKMGKMSWSSA